ncbi:hypothetical protein BY996DRAFT_6783842 [Phakopsora pachyrhizi]|nr:hypothetical protein BY996DRAFT_6783842 [Phakopsora pachyrhizi]
MLFFVQCGLKNLASHFGETETIGRPNAAQMGSNKAFDFIENPSKEGPTHEPFITRKRKNLQISDALQANKKKFKHLKADYEELRALAKQLIENKIKINYILAEDQCEQIEKILEAVSVFTRFRHIELAVENTPRSVHLELKRGVNTLDHDVSQIIAKDLIDIILKDLILEHIGSESEKHILNFAIKVAEYLSESIALNSNLKLSIFKQPEFLDALSDLIYNRCYELEDFNPFLLSWDLEDYIINHPGIVDTRFTLISLGPKERKHVLLNQHSQHHITEGQPLEDAPEEAQRQTKQNQHPGSEVPKVTRSTNEPTTPGLDKRQRKGG